MPFLEIFYPNKGLGLQSPRRQRSERRISGVTIEGRARRIGSRNDGIEHAQVQEIKGVVFYLFHSLSSQTFIAMLGGNVHSQGGATVSRVKIEQIDAPDGRARRVFHHQPQLTVTIDIAGSGSNIIPQVLLGQGVMIGPVRPSGCIVLPLVEIRQVGRFYFSQFNH